MVRDQPGLQISVSTEPLKSAFEVQDLKLRFNEHPQAFPEPETALKIERRSRYDRLGAAEAADIFLFQSTRQWAKRPSNPALADRLVSALGVWASTRSHMGLLAEAQVAMGRVLQWVDGDNPGSSSTYAYAYQRSARLLSEQSGLSGTTMNRLLSLDVDREFHAALIEHLLTSGGEAPLGSGLLDFGRALVQRGEPARGRTFLRAALARLDPVDPILSFEARRWIASSLLTENRITEAEQIMAPIDANQLSPVDRRDWFHLCAHWKETQEEFTEALELRVDALDLAVEVCGHEQVLEDLLTAGWVRDQVQGELDAGLEGRLTQAIQHLMQAMTHTTDITSMSTALQTTSWREKVRSLAKRLISGKSPEDTGTPSFPMADAMRRQLESWHQELLGPEGIHFLADAAEVTEITEEWVPMSRNRL